MKIWAISDTHNKHNNLVVPEDVDLVIHAGDATNSYSLVENVKEAKRFFKWFNGLDIPNKIYVPGNHDLAVYNDMIDISYYPTITPLIRSSVRIGGLNFYGSPYTVNDFDRRFAYPIINHRDNLYEWGEIPYDTDVLITHGPPYGVQDVYDDGSHTGDAILADTVAEHSTLAYHIYGHAHTVPIYKNSGVLDIGDITYVNASTVNSKNKTINNGIILDI